MVLLITFIILKFLNILNLEWFPLLFLVVIIKISEDK